MAKNASGAPPVAATLQDPLVIDILGAYVDGAFGPNTNEAIVRSNFELNLELCNTAYANSGIPLRVRLAGIVRTTYAENTRVTDVESRFEALEALRLRNDGRMDEIHAARDAVGADLVFLALARYAPGAGGPSGQSYIQEFPSVRDPRARAANPEHAFCVVKARADNNLSALVHELGHNFGCAHDRPNAGGTGGAFSYSHGFKFTAANGRRLSTIMGIPASGESTVLYFSNPRLTPPELGVPVGVAEGLAGETDNAQTITRAMFEIGAFRLRPEIPPERKLLDVSTRAFAGGGEQSLIGGFFIGGEEPMKVVVRVLGPSLAAFGVQEPMANPAFEIRGHPDGRLVAEIDDWPRGEAGSVAELQASGLAPASDREPAALLHLPPGGYTVVVRPANGQSGQAIVEAYGLGADRSRLSNLSTRAYVDGNGREMIGGFVVEGQPGEMKRIVIRALGPTLREFGVVNALDDPVIALHDETGALLLVSDDFSAAPPGSLSSHTYGQEAVFAAGLQPGNRLEPCVMLDLPRGAYTVIVRSTNQAARGIALIEVYEVPR